MCGMQALMFIRLTKLDGEPIIIQRQHLTSFENNLVSLSNGKEISVKESLDNILEHLYEAEEMFPEDEYEDFEPKSVEFPMPNKTWEWPEQF